VTLAAIGPGAREAVPALKALLQDSVFENRRQAALTLGQIGPEAAAALPDLVEAWKDRRNSPTVLLQVAHALHRIDVRNQAGVEELKSLLTSPDLYVRGDTISILARLGSEARSVLPVFKEALKSPDTRLRTQAALALALLGEELPQVVPLLVEELRGSTTSARAQVLQTLGQLGPAARDAVPALMDMLRAPGAYAPSSAEFLVLLGEIGPEAGKAIPVVRSFLTSPNQQYRQAAAWALCRIDPAYWPEVQLLLVERFRDLTQIPNYRPQAARFLGRLGGLAGETAPLLRAAMHDEAETVETRVEAALALWRVKQGTPAIVPILAGSLAHKDVASLQEEMIAVLGEIGVDAKAAVPALNEMKKANDPRVRQAAAAALQRIDLETLPRPRAVDERK
jgi:HEAT repeat protein